MSEVQYVELVTKEEAFQRLQREWKDNPEILENLEPDPVPASILVWLDDPAQANEFAKNLQGRPEVDEVKVPSMDFAPWTALLRGMTRAPGLSEEMPPDFTLLAAYGVQAKNKLDTAAGTFTKDIVSMSKPNPTAELRLTREELATLYRSLKDMGILDYPSVFRPQLEAEATTGTSTMVSPHNTYLLSIRAGGMEKTISWEDESLSATPEAKALRDWFDALRQMIEAKPEYRAIPPAENAYAWAMRAA